ncbi:hypothetical protein [Rubellicoccus peritrichatus]|uniref:Phytase-like domain-containing protein n=1 Tax=Rubellicoccus peritrichatus TaxID=3080537 RepID=A0AAQ3QVP9_9BACT|nr:hypothetical protein [Puniceicoccus sp. CR14]WOO41853.1 hypothetical protein RZN69_02050 [Puniceicoccus sp. CR14]
MIVNRRDWTLRRIWSNADSSIIVSCLCLFSVVFLTACSGPWASERAVVNIPVPQLAPRALQATGYISEPAINESSGLAKSDRYPNTFWTLNDSGDRARIFAIHEDGSLIRPNDGKPYDGITVEGASNIDWEDIAKGPDGTLLIADTGNNANKRLDLVVYVISEPNPLQDHEVTVTRTIPVYFPEQKAFPPENNNFDCEAVFYFGDSLYFLAKHRADRLSAFYRLPYSSLEEGPEDPRGYPLRLTDTYNLRGIVTAADAFQSRKVAILTYDSVWVFDQIEAIAMEGTTSMHPLFRNGYWQPVRAKQCEAIAFIDEDTLLISNEQRDLYVLSIDEMAPIGRASERTSINNRELGHL